MLPGIGVFGSGVVVKVLVTILREKGFKIEALWGRTLTEAQETAKELQIPFCTNKIDDVLLRKDVDLIFVMCAPSLHAQIAVKALGIGKHVVCDRPAGLNQAETLKMVSAAQYYPSLISLVNHSLRFLPAFYQMRKAIAEEYLGAKSTMHLIDIKVHMHPLIGDHFDWLCDEAMGGGTLTLVGSHLIDLVTYLTGERALRVHGMLRTFTKHTDRINGIRSITAPDYCVFQMELASGILVNVTLNNHVATTFSQEFLICGANGYLAVRGGDLFGRKFAENKTQEDVLYLDVEDLTCVTPTIVPRLYIKGLCKMIGVLKEAFLPVQDQTGWVKEPVQLAATFDDGLYVQAVMDAIKRSSKNRQWEIVRVLDEQPDPNPLLSAAVRKTAISLT